MELVSIIVPVYNAEEYIGTCIESIQKQSYQNIEILLVDDGSMDKSAEICDKYQQEDSRIKVFHRKNHGVSSSRNYGIEYATGDYIQFVDADDSLEPETVEENLKIVKETGAELVFFSFRYHIVDENKILDKVFSEMFVGNAEEFFNKFFVTLINRELINPPWNKFISKKLLKNTKVRFHEEYSICEDMAFSIEILNESKLTAFNPKMHYNYNLKSTGSLVFRFHENYFEALSYYYQKALQYCNRFKENEEALRILDTSYVSLTIMYLKQISCYGNWDLKQKLNKIRSITYDSNLQNALRNSELGKKKKLVGVFIKFHCRLLIYVLYQLQKII